jgi:UDP-glucose 4-epimerase
MNVLVLGGHGFIGSHIVERLLQDGYHVRVFARQPNPTVHKVENVIGDFLDIAKISESLSNIDAVIHCISTTVPSTSALDPEYDVETNLLGSIRLLRIMEEQGVKRIVYLSSGGTVYGNPVVTPVPESAPLNPVSSYGAVKVAIEKFIDIMHMNKGLQSVILRPSNPYGERQGHTGVQGLISTLLYNTLKGIPSLIYGDGTAVRDYIHVSDIANLVGRILASDHCGVYNAGYGEGRSVLQIIESIENVIGMAVPINFMPARGFDVKEIILDSSLAHQHFGWRPSVFLEQGIKRQYEWVRERYGSANR